MKRKGNGQRLSYTFLSEKKETDCIQEEERKKNRYRFICNERFQ
jgi:hypothetical protein